MQNKLSITASLEDYLKTIHSLESQERVARAKDIARRMSVSRASVTGALKSLSQKGLIDYSPYSFITLTENGRGLARDLLEKHQALRGFFIDVLSLEPQASEELACKLEHTITSEAVEKLSSLHNFLNKCPRGAACWDHLESKDPDGQVAEICRVAQSDALCSSCKDASWSKTDKI